MNRRILCLTAALLLALTLPATAVPPAAGSAVDPFLTGVQKRVLPNGLTLLTREQKGTGVVAINTWVEAGYFNEADEIAGMAHLFEHMFFKGSKAFPGAEQISRELAAVGGQSNAGTIYDSTNYYFVVPKEGFRRALEIQADAIANPLFDPAELKKEAEVVIEESNRKLDNPPAVSLERMYATAFTKHRMKRWRIGSNEVLRNIRRDNLLAFFETLYRPGNIILTVTGDVPASEVESAVKSTFGRIPRGTLKKERGPEEPAQTEFRYGESSGDIRQGYSALGWHTPGVGSPDEGALTVLAQILGGGRSSRLYVGAVAPDAASTVTASNDTFEDIGLFSVLASFDEKNRLEVDRRVLREVERIKAHGPTVYEMQQAKNVLEAGIVGQLEDALGQAQTLSLYEARYGYRALGTQLAEMRSMTPERVREVARRYLVNENLTLYHYTPRDAKPMTADAALSLVKETTAAAPEALAEAAVPPPSAPVRAAGNDSTIREMKLSSGATLIAQERRGAPLVSVGIYFEGGRIDENSRNAGITQLMTRSMRRGTASRSARDIDRQIEFLGTQIQPDIAEDFFGFAMDVVASNFASGLEILSDVVLNPVFPAEGVKEEKFLQSAAIKRTLDSSQDRPLQLLGQALYGSHPYGLPANGDMASVASIEEQALRDWWRGHVVADGAVILVVGDIAAEDAKKAVERQLAGLTKRQMPRAAAGAPLPPAARTEIVEFRDRKQSAITVGFPTVGRTHEDWPALRLLTNITSGLAGTFFAELRGRRSLAYTVWGRDISTGRSGAFVGYLATEAGKENEAREALLAEIRKIPVDEFGEKDLKLGQSSLSGSTRIRLETNGANLLEMVRNRYYGLPLDFGTKLIEKTNGLTLEQIRAVAGKYLTSDRFVEGIMRGK